MSALVVIPARYGSTRFPGKPLAMLQGKPLIQHVYEQAAQAKRVDEVVVATDDERILEAVKGFQGMAVMTSTAARSGTERVAEVARSRSAQIIINVQGDEPLIHPEMVDQLADYLERHSAVPMASLMTPLKDASDVSNANVVKVVVDRDGFALYFSRAPIPYRRQETGDRRQANDQSHVPGPRSQVWKHIGIDGYQRHFL
jgi:3-deoxy-manno-octulosonate cytidylyltransferase (CMP-KDO synthetase)